MLDPHPFGAHRGARWVSVAVVGCLSAAPLALPAAAQLPALPAAQSAFPAPGLALALNAGRGDGRTVGSLAAAVGARRLQLTAALGLPGAPDAYNRRGVSLGARLAGRLYRTPRLGVSAFAGYGSEGLRTAAFFVDSTVSVDPKSARQIDATFIQVPVGLSAGYRGLAGTRPYALSVAPMYVYSRFTRGSTRGTRSGVRLAALAELAVTRRIGVGLAGELGSGGPDRSPYTGSRTVVGAGVSYALHRVVAR